MGWSGEFSLYLLFVFLPAIMLVLWLNERNKKQLAEQIRRTVREEIEREKQEDNKSKAN